MSPRIILFVSLRKAATFRRKPNDEYSTEVTREVFSLERSPMKLAGILSLVLIGAALAGCNLKEKYARNNLAADHWPQANIGSSGLNVTGAVGGRGIRVGSYSL
jgi:hypothetical protein